MAEIEKEKGSEPVKIAFFEIKEEERAFFKTHLKGHELLFFEKTIQQIVTEKKEFEAVSIFVHSQISNELLANLPGLRYLQTRSTGFDHVKCKHLYQKQIKVSNVAGYAGPAVAEFAFSLLLNATRKTHLSIQRSKSGNEDYFDLKGVELYGKKLGILGLGTIGLQMAEIGKGFGMDILGFSRTHKPVYDEIGIAFLSLEDVLQNTDFLMIALPLTPATEHIIDSATASLIKKECILINIARCEILEPSLYVTLPNMIATDVCGDITLAKKENILYTPHMAYYTTEALARIQTISLENMQDFLEEKTPRNCLKIECEKEYADA
ncbi:MAG: NAD(P)-dependent oxidoreductase [Sulfurimonas sp.]